MRPVARTGGARRPGRGLIVLLCAAALWASAPAGLEAIPPPADQDFPKPLGYVSDFAGVLSPDWEGRIRSVCKDLERKTGVEMVVVTVDSIEPYKQVREYADALYKYWRIGSAQEQHGIMLLAYSERPQASVTLGRNMIRVIPPAAMDEATRRYIEPAFQVGHFGEGLYRTAVALAAAAQDVRVGEPPQRKRRAAGVWIMAITVVVVVGFFWLIARPDKRHPFPRVRRGEFWGTGRGGFGAFGGFGGAGSKEKW